MATVKDQLKDGTANNFLISDEERGRAGQASRRLLDADKQESGRSVSGSRSCGSSSRPWTRLSSRQHRGRWHGIPGRVFPRDP